MNLTYIVELKDWENNDSYPTAYTGTSLLIALNHFKAAHLKGQDVIMYTEDQEGNTIDTLENYGQIDNIIKCKELFTPNDEQLIKEHKEATRQKEIYNSQYIELLNENDKLKKENESLQKQLRSHKQQENNTNNLYWYEYKLRGFSPFCQPKGHIEHDESKGRWGIIAYDRELTQEELYEYDLKVYKTA